MCAGTHAVSALTCSPNTAGIRETAISLTQSAVFAGRRHPRCHLQRDSGPSQWQLSDEFTPAAACKEGVSGVRSSIK